MKKSGFLIQQSSANMLQLKKFIILENKYFTESWLEDFALWNSVGSSQGMCPHLHMADRQFTECKLNLFMLLCITKDCTQPSWKGHQPNTFPMLQYLVV